MTRLELPNNQWFEVKDKLKVRDKRDVHAYSVDGVSSDGLTYRFNVVKHQIANAAVRIINWSLFDDGNTHRNGKPEAIQWPIGKASFKERVEVVESLDEDVFDVIVMVLNKHIKEVEVDDEDEKKEIPDGEIVSPTSLPSAS